MKTHILKLDAHDDIISTRDKMGWSKAGRILLIWPDRGQLLTRRLDLVLLQRHAAALGAQLALVTRDPRVAEHAIELAIPTFKDLRLAQRGAWRPAGRRRPPLHPTLIAPPGRRADLREGRARLGLATPAWLDEKSGRAAIFRGAFFALGVLAFLLLAAALFPAAQLHLVSDVKNQAVSLTLHADPAISSYNLSGQVPARPRSSVVEGRRSLPAQGRIYIPGQAATGSVIFTNLTQQALNIPAGVIIRTLQEQPLRFTTLRSGRLPAGPGQQISLPVSAVLAGKTGNLPPNALTAVEGRLGLQLTANNPSATTGGLDVLVPIATQANRQQLFDTLQTELRASALREIQSQLSPGDILFTSTLTITRILDQSYTPAEIQPADVLDLSLRIEFRALVTTAAEIQSLGTAILDASLPEGYAPLPESLNSIATSQPDQALAWQAAFTRQVQAVIPPARAVGLVLGTTPRRAASRLSAALPLAAPPGILLTPRWWPILPLLPFRITLE